MKITGKFANAEAYDRNTGRFSRMLAGAFIEFAGSYLESLSPDKQEVLRLRVRERVLGKGPDRPFTLKAKAWAVRGLC